MKIKSVTLICFRGYAEPVKVEVDNLCVLVGKNDIGKSTILEALDIFFNEGKGCVKLDKDDINKNCVANGNDCIEIAVEFTDLPVHSSRIKRVKSHLTIGCTKTSNSLQHSEFATCKLWH